MLIAFPKALKLSSPSVAATFTALRATALWTPNDPGSVHDLFIWLLSLATAFSCLGLVPIWEMDMEKLGRVVRG
jgi:hypothetical protein